MKRFLTLGFIVTLISFGSWIGAQIEVTTSTVITVASRAVDDTGTYVTPDSVRIVVYREGVEAFDAWFESADGECSELNTQLVFFDAFGDIDGGAGTGIYQVSANFKESDDEYWVNTWYNLVDTTTQSYGSIIYWKADSVAGAVTATNKANFKATGFATSTQGDSVTQAISDANKANFKATGFASSVQGDSVTQAISDVNKANFKADVSGLSTFDASSDSTFPDISHLWNLGVILTGADADSFLKIRDYTYTVQESINAHAPHGDDWASVGAGGADLSDEVDSLLAVFYDRTNDSNFVRLIAHLLLHDSVTIDNSDAWDLSGGTDLSSEVDSLLAVLYDRTNDSNFVRLIAHLILHDSLTIDISNAWGLRSGLSTHGASDIATLWGDTLTLLIAFRDSVNNAIADANKGNFKANVWDEDTSAHNAAGSYGVMLKDTSAYQGEAAGLTKEEIVTEFEDRGYGFGGGILACTVYVRLNADSSALSGIHIVARNTDEDELLGHCYTNANGWCALVLDSIAGGAYHKFWLMDVDYSFTFPESADVNIDTSVTFYGSAFDYGDPPAENQCAVYGQIFDAQLDSLSGAIIKARVYVPPDSVLRYDDHIISPFIVSDTTTVTGRWRLDLIPNSLFTPTDTWYIFTFEKPSPWGGTIVDEDTLTVPELESHQY